VCASLLLALVAALQLVEMSVPSLAQAALHSSIADGAALTPSCEPVAPLCDPQGKEPTFAASGGAPCLLAVASARHVPAMPPIAELSFVLAAQPDTGTLRASHRMRPSEGLDVPACRSEQRWRLAHTTATSPA